MKLVQLFFLLLFSVFSSFVMSYIALATMIGPWMGPTLILIGLLITSVLRRFTSHDMLLPVIGGSLGGIIATCISFSFPTYYFIDKDFFTAWAENPILLIFIISTLSMAAGFSEPFRRIGRRPYYPAVVECCRGRLALVSTC